MPPRRTDRLAVVGGSIAGLATALVAARHGYAVDLYVEPARAGGSFAGVTAGERRFDLGCRLFELDYEAGPAVPVDPAHGTHRPLIQEIAGFIRSILGNALRPAAEPEMWVNATRTRCPLMTVDLTDFPAVLPDAEQAAIRHELAFASHAGPGADLQTASLAQHGRRLHERLIEPLCAKQTPCWADTLASHRRKLWMALFHPETLRQAFNHEPPAFRPYRPFTTTVVGTAYPFADRLLQAARAEPGVTCIPVAALTKLGCAPHGQLALWFGSAAPITLPAAATVLALPPEQLFRAAGVPYALERTGAAILWVDVPEADLLAPPSSLMLCDPGLRPFRISGAGRAPDGRHTLAVEFGAATPCLEAAETALRVTGTIRPGATVRPVHQVTAPAQAAPTAANLHRFEEALARFRCLSPACAVVGHARRFGWDSMNDQLADAIHFGASRL